MTDEARSHAMDHVVLVIFENRSLDNLLGHLYGPNDGKAFDGGTADDVALEIGSGQFIPGFEEQLVGAKPGDEVVVKVTFPAEYQAANLAGKDAEFEVKVHEVKAPKAGNVTITYTPDDGSEPMEFEVVQIPEGGGVVMGMYNYNDSIGANW